jgi:hypothetical protein
MRKIAHDIRVVNAVYHIETATFGPDDREERTIVGRKILTNLFQLGTALVYQNGTATVVSSRDASRAAASVALRSLKMGQVPAHLYHVEMRNRRGMAHSETVHFGFDHAPIRDNDIDGVSQSNIERSEMGHVSDKRIDDVVFHHNTVDADGEMRSCECCGMCPCTRDQFGNEMPQKETDDADPK